MEINDDLKILFEKKSIKDNCSFTILYMAVTADCVNIILYVLSGIDLDVLHKAMFAQSKSTVMFANNSFGHNFMGIETCSMWLNLLYRMKQFLIKNQ